MEEFEFLKLEIDGKEIKVESIDYSFRFMTFNQRNISFEFTFNGIIEDLERCTREHEVKISIKNTNEIIELNHNMIPFSIDRVFDTSMKTTYNMRVV